MLMLLLLLLLLLMLMLMLIGVLHERCVWPSSIPLARRAGPVLSNLDLPLPPRRDLPPPHHRCVPGKIRKFLDGLASLGVTMSTGKVSQSFSRPHMVSNYVIK